MTSVQMLDHEIKMIGSKARAENPYFLKLLRWMPPRPIDTEKQHALFLEALKKISLLLNELDSDPSTHRNPQAKIQREGHAQYARVIEDLIVHYERDRFPSNGSPKDTLVFLMEQHGLTQKDIAADFGGQPNVSAVLSGKREFNLDQVRRLSARFHVSPITFIVP